MTWVLDNEAAVNAFAGVLVRMMVDRDRGSPVRVAIEGDPEAADVAITVKLRKGA